MTHTQVRERQTINISIERFVKNRRVKRVFLLPRSRSLQKVEAQKSKSSKIITHKREFCARSGNGDRTSSRRGKVGKSNGRGREDVEEAIVYTTSLRLEEAEFNAATKTRISDQVFLWFLFFLEILTSSAEEQLPCVACCPDPFLVDGSGVAEEVEGRAKPVLYNQK